MAAKFICGNVASAIPESQEKQDAGHAKVLAAPVVS
jgi:hypothetical protein